MLPALAVALASCRSSNPLEAPSLAAVQPATGSADEAVQVTILGAAFYARAEQGLGGASSRVDDTFRAWLGETALIGVRRLDASRLAATVPRDLAPGTYDLTVQGPFGTSTLARAYTATAQAAQLTASLGVPAQVDPGQELTLTLQVQNPGGRAALGVTPTLLLSGPGGLLLEAPAPASAEVPAGGSVDFVFQGRATTPGAVTLEGSASGTEESSGAALSATASGQTTVRGRVGLVGAARVPARVSVGQTFTAALTATNPGASTVRAVAPTLTVPAGLTLLASPPPQEVAAGGAGTLFEWSVRADTAGAQTLAFTALGLDEDGAPVFLPAVEAAVTVQHAAALSGTLSARPVRVSVGQLLTLELAVSNSGEAAALAVLPDAPEALGPGAANPQGGFPDAQDIPGGETRAFVLEYLASGDGALTFSVEAQGADENSGAAVSMPAAVAGAVTVQHPDLHAVVTATPATVTTGQTIAVRLEASNQGTAAISGVAPTISYRGTGTLVAEAGPTPAGADLAAGQSADFEWTWRAISAGVVSFEGAVGGTDAASGLPVASLPATSAEIRVLRRAALTGVLTGPAQAVVGAAVDLQLHLSNAGESDAIAVAPDALVLSGTAAATVTSGPSPASAPVPAGGAAVFTWTLSPTSEGTLTATAIAAGTDATDGAPATAASASASVTIGSRATLTAALGAPTLAAPGVDFPLTLTVTNTGSDDATAVTPSPLATSGSGTPTLRTGPSPASADLAAGASQTFSWTFRATAGEVTFEGSATGTDAVDLLPTASAPSQLTVKIAEAEPLLTDPFGDGTAFSYLFGYRGKLWLGPRKDGYGAVRANPDGSGLETASFSFTRDDDAPTKSANNSPAPYPSIGTTSCTANTAACGPDNENGRGLFTAGTLAGQEWLFLAGARTPSTLHYGYMTSDPGPALGFSFLDLTPLLENQTHGVSAAHVFHDRLYLGLPDDSPDRPFFLSLTTPPTAPGTAYVNGPDALHLDGGMLPAVGANVGNGAAVAIIDRIGDFADRLYVFNNGGCARATVPDPRPVGVAATDWKDCTATAPAWKNRAALTTNKLRDLEPSDKATPQLAEWKGRLYALRNTTVGPQLWACTPSKTGEADHCDPADWALVAPNSTGDNLLTQFNNPANSAATLLVATPSSLYVGFDNPSGLVLMRTRAANPTTRADFTGAGNCPATGHPATCAGFGGSGLGAPQATRVFDALALPYQGHSYVYLSAGSGSGPVRVFRVVE